MVRRVKFVLVAAAAGDGIHMDPGGSDFPFASFPEGCIPSLSRISFAREEEEFMSGKPVAAGKSSFELIDQSKALGLIAATAGSRVVDLACGLGRYSLAIAPRVGQSGLVYAVDLWPEGIASLRREIAERGITNIRPIVADIRSRLPIDEGSIDACLLAAVFHDLAPEERRPVLQEVVRLLRPGGALTIVEFKKIAEGPGPPIRIRMDEADIEALVAPWGFVRVAVGEVGKYNYLVKYERVA